MNEEEDMFPPFWLQTSDSIRQSNRLRRTSFSSVFFSSGAFVLALLAVALVFILFIIPSVLSITSQIFRPHSVKKSWDSLNLVLVLFAIVCGFLSRNNNNDNNSIRSPTSYDQVHHPTVFNGSSVFSPQARKSNPSTPRQWYDQYSDRTAYNSISTKTSMNSRVRTSSSYPDLRQQEASWATRDELWRSYDDTHVTNHRVSGLGSDHLHRRHQSWEEAAQAVLPQEAAEHVQPNSMNSRVRTSSYPDLRQQEASGATRDERWRFYDDTHVTNYRVSDSGSDHLRHRRHQSWHEGTAQAVLPQEEAEHVQPKNIQVDTFVVRTEHVNSSHTPIPTAQSDPPAPSAPPPRKSKRTYQAVGDKKNSNTTQNIERNGNLEVEKILPPSLSRSWRPQAPPLPPLSTPPQISKSAGKNVKKRGVATTKEFLISSLRRKKKKQRQKSVENFGTLLSSAISDSSSLLPPPSPPPPPPPLPPPPSVFHNLFSSKKFNKPKKTFHSIPQPTQKPLLPVKLSSFNNVDDDSANSGGESPLVRIPPPPPPPPFRMPAMKFVVHGDFVRIKSYNSSRSGTPDFDDSEDQDSPTMESASAQLDSISKVMALEGGGDSGESPKAMFCSSPDVNTKADTFIARFRAGLRMEKNSVRGRSNLGLDTREG